MPLTAASSLKLDRVLDIGMKAFVRRVAPLLMFSRVLSAQEVSRDKVIQVPFVPLEGAASADWDC